MLNIFSIYELLNSIDLYKIAIRLKLKEEYENFVSNLKNNNKQLLLNLKEPHELKLGTASVASEAFSLCDERKFVVRQPHSRLQRVKAYC